MYIYIVCTLTCELWEKHLLHFSHSYSFLSWWVKHGIMMIEQAINHSNCCIQGAKISFLVHNQSWSKQRDFANRSRCQLLYNQDKFTILPDMEYEFCKINLYVIRQNMYVLFKTGLLKWFCFHKNAYLQGFRNFEYIPYMEKQRVVTDR